MYIAQSVIFSYANPSKLRHSQPHSHLQHVCTYTHTHTQTPHLLLFRSFSVYLFFFLADLKVRAGLKFLARSDQFALAVKLFWNYRWQIKQIIVGQGLGQGLVHSKHYSFSCMSLPSPNFLLSVCCALSGLKRHFCDI